MANETNFSSKKLTLWRETTKGVTPATIAKAYSTTALSFSLMETQKTEKNPTLGNGGQGSATDFGGSDYAGNVEVKYTGGIMPILVTHVIGTPVKTDAVAIGWTLNTVTTAGTIINSVSGLYSLVCKVAGTTGATEPVYTGLTDGASIVDGSVTWIYRSAKLKSYAGSLSPCLETLGLQMESQTGCDVTPVTFTERYNGVFLNSMEISKSGGNVIYKYSIPVVSMSRSDSTQGIVAHPALVVTSESAIVDNAFGYDEAVVTIGGVEPVNCNSFKITINRNTALEYGIAVNTKIDNTPIVDVSGEFTLKFTVEKYAELYANASKRVIVTLSKSNGDSLVLTLPSVEQLRAPITYATDKPIYLTAKINAVGSAATPTVSYVARSTTNW